MFMVQMQIGGMGKTTPTWRACNGQFYSEKLGEIIFQFELPLGAKYLNGIDDRAPIKLPLAGARELHSKISGRYGADRVRIVPVS